MKLFSFLARIALLLTITACSKESSRNNFEDYGDIYQKNGNSFVVSEKTHPTGWGHDRCYMCHNPDNIHQVDRVEAIDVDLAKIRLQIESGGMASCTNCHGSNGN